MSVAATSVLDQRAAEALLAELTEEVREVEKELIEAVGSPVRLVARICRHTLDAGGKRLRPAFVSLSAKATGMEFDPERVRRLGACMEMIHMATLIHDDVIDNAALRRGRETASSAFGNTGSILAGDVLLAKSMSILALDGDLQIIRHVSEAVVDMAEGEVRELETRNAFDLPEADHLEVLHKKTASFIRSCCAVGALAAGAPEPMRVALEEYGYHIGMAFQIVDDLLDYRGDRSATGKPRATDFREGCATLPLIYLREKLTDSEREMVSNRFGNGVTDDELDTISRWMSDRGAFDMAEADARRHVELASARLHELPDGSTRRILESVGEYVLSRQA